MTEVKMLKTFPISPDGLRVETWAENSTQTVDDDTLAILFNEGACEIIENKAHMVAPENKARGRRARK